MRYLTNHRRHNVDTQHLGARTVDVAALLSGSWGTVDSSQAEHSALSSGLVGWSMTPAISMPAPKPVCGVGVVEFENGAQKYPQPASEDTTGGTDTGNIAGFATG